MTQDEVELAGRLAKDAAALLHQVPVARAMGAVFADAMLPAEVLRQGICVCPRAHRLMESCVKDCNLHCMHTLFEGGATRGMLTQKDQRHEQYKRLSKSMRIRRSELHQRPLIHALQESPLECSANAKLLLSICSCDWSADEVS